MEWTCLAGGNGGPVYAWCQRNRTDNVSPSHLPLRIGMGRRGFQCKEIRYSLEFIFSPMLASHVHAQQRANRDTSKESGVHLSKSLGCRWLNLNLFLIENSSFPLSLMPTFLVISSGKKEVVISKINFLSVSWANKGSVSQFCCSLVVA